MQRFFQYDPKMEPFRLFSVEHLLTIGIIFSLSILMLYSGHVLKTRERRDLVRFSLVLLLVVSEMSEHIWLMSEKAWNVRRDLPLQLSDLAVILAMIMLLSKNDKLFQFMYFAGLGSSIQAIVTPDLHRFSFPHFQYIEFFVSHGGVILACLFMVAVFHCMPSIRSLWITILIVNLYAVCVFFLNKLLKANYLYLMKKMGSASLLDYLGSWPWYLLVLEPVMVLSFYLLYSPIWMKRKGMG